MSNKKITKRDLVDSIYQSVNLEKNSIQAVLDEFFENVKDNLCDGNTIELRGFGTFEQKLRNGREKARNPKTGETVSVPPHYVVSFRPGQELRNNLYNLPVQKD
jgi:integration host factor subunit beta